MSSVPLEVKLRVRWRRLVARKCECQVDQDGNTIFCHIHIMDKDRRIFNGLQFARTLKSKLEEEEGLK